MLKIKIFFILAILLSTSFAVFGQTDDWKLYSSTRQGFAVKYPSDWTAKEETYGRVWHSFFISPGVRDYDVIQNAGIIICSQPKGHISTSSNSRSRCSQRDDHLSDIAKDKVVSEENLEINGEQIRKKITENKYRPEATFIYAFFSTEDRDFLVSSNFPRRFDLDKYIPVFDKMLSTLLLIEKDDSISYRNEKYNFSIDFPASWRSCPIDYYAIKRQEILILVPDEKLCLNPNYIAFSTVSEATDKTKLLEIKKLFLKENYSQSFVISELPNFQTISAEKTEGKYFYRQRFFYAQDSEIYYLMKISEMYNKDENFETQAKRILETARTF